MKTKILRKLSTGEYMPVDKEDTLLLKWCQNYNKKIGEDETAKYAEAPICTNLLYYYTPYKRDSELNEWCRIHNEELKQQRRDAHERERKGGD